MQRKVSSAVLGILLVFPVFGQTLSFETYMETVKEHHPQMRRNAIDVEQAEANIKVAKGDFDPVLYSEGSTKELAKKDYYTKITAGLAIPTWFGTTFNVAYDNNSGEYLNPEAYTPQDGLLNVGLEIDILQGLVMDKRKAAMRKAEWYHKASIEQQKIARNDLLYEAAVAYRKWQSAYYIYILTKSFAENAQIRFEGIRQSMLIGESSGMDTLEANLQMLDRQTQVLERDLEFRNATLVLNLFLWMDGVVPLEIDGATPEVIEKQMTPLFNPLEDSLLATHPKVMSATYGMEAINVGILSEKFRLLPSLKVKYNWLTGFDAAAYPASIGNYNAGFSFSYPLFLRQSRNTLQFSKFQLEDYSLYRSQASLEVRQMVMSARNELYINFEQLKIQRQIVQQYESLYQYEYILFDNGESSLFRLNIRELKLIEVQIKLIKNQIENEIAKHKYDKSLMVM